ncbi:MAG: hypothetical protein GBAus27B_000456 [Mycoplasmataceae bacterium]|nr:MAG: hypothetical protein GBAus27B_000456 [Mycoplasmataceae bacterium]
MTNLWGTWDIETKKNCSCSSSCSQHTSLIDKWSVQLSNTSFYQGESKKELINLIVSFSQKKSYRYLLYAHNGNAYDIFFLINSLIKLLTSEEKANFKPKRNKNSWQELRFKNIRFLDSYLLLKMKLGDMMNPEERKLKSLVSFDTNNQKIYQQELAQQLNLNSKEAILNEYNRNDTQALYRILDQVWQEYPQAKGKLTIAGFSFYTWKKENPQQLRKLNNLAKPWADEEREFCEQGYFAALEDCFNESIYEGWINKYDMNAFYAHLMRENIFPLGRPRFMRKIRQEFNPEHEIGFIEVEFEDLRIKEEEDYVPFLTIEDQGIKVNFGFCKTYRAVLPTPLLDLALRAYSYSKFTILRKCLFLKKEQGFFEDYVNKYSAIKENSPKGSLDYVMAKNMLTNLYGKFGQHVFRKNWELKPVSKKLSFTPTYWDKHGNPWHFVLGKEDQRSQGFNYCPISAFTTAYARIHMVKMIKQLGINNILYCAKDSLVSKVALPTELIDPVKTGAWKLEDRAWGFISHASKSYQVGEHKKIAKGLRREEAQLLDYRQLQTEPIKVNSQTSFKTNEGVIITHKEKTLQPSSKNLKKDLKNSFWNNQNFYHDWAWWNKQKNKLIKT